MKKIVVKIAFAIVFIWANGAQAQEFNGKAYYASKTNIDSEAKFEIKGMDPNQMKMIKEQMKKALEKNYILSFNKTESIFEEEEKLDAPDAVGFKMKMASGNDDKLYKNIKEKQTISENEFFGKEFLIVDKLLDYSWKLDEQTKKIGDYVCYKATAIVPVSEQDKKIYDDYLKKSKDSKSQFFMMKEPKEQTITVWYTPDIPVSHGPANFYGLPGLILESNFDKTTILCTKVVLNPKEKVEIKKLNKGKKVTKAEHEDIIKKQMEQMNHNKSGSGGMQIHIAR